MFGESDILWSEEFEVDPEGKKVLVFCCSDGRFVNKTHKFVEDHLVVKNFNFIAVPGAIHFLVSKLLKASWIAKQWVKFFADHHGTNRVIIIHHQDCGWYKFLHNSEHYRKDIFDRQKEDDEKAKNSFKPGVAESYFLSFDETSVKVQKM
ncbi:hypothetical protein HYT01_00500 [Candidatus Giovannonibacteria bacterium]|nr:hypothetical protein [Candidatus Giovannonibacteria bacterium]